MKGGGKLSIKNKILTVILSTTLGSLLVLGLVVMVSITDIRRITLSYSDDLGRQATEDSKAVLETEIRHEMIRLARDKAALVNEKFRIMENQTRRLAAAADYIYTHKEQYRPKSINYLQPEEAGTIVPYLMTAPGVSFSSIKDEVFLAANISDILREFMVVDIGLNASYLAGEAGYVIMIDKNASAINNTSFDFKSRAWYTGALEKDGLFWTNAFTDAFGRGSSISCAVPFYDYSGETRVFKGVAGSGSLLTDVERIIYSSKIGQTGYGFLLDNNGRVIISPEEKIAGSDYLYHDNPELRELAERMLGKQEGIIQLTLSGEDVYIAFSPLETVDLSMGIVMSIEEVAAPVRSIQQTIINLTGEANNGINRSFLKLLMNIAGVIVLTSGIAVLVGFRLSRSLTTPLVKLCKGAEIIGSGDLNHQLEVASGDEIGSLAGTFNQMIRDIKTINGEKERINGELSAAADIQRSMLPRIFPKFTERRELSLYAEMTPAKEVGGDFYDFFYLDREETKIACIIADVSGKGMPAALFMVIAKTLLKIHLLRGINPAETLEAVNKLLCEENPQNMFVTVFVCSLDLTTGKMFYANGGHNPPLLSVSGEAYHFMRLKKGVPLGMFEESRYYQEEKELRKGDKLYLYTDGINEAMNGEEEQFGNGRFMERANRWRELPPKGFDEAIRRELFLFTAGAEQSDDITTLAIMYTGGNTGMPPEYSPVFEQEITLPAILDNLDRLLEWVDAFLTDHSCPAKTCHQMAMAAEEIFVNIVNYAYPGKTGDVTVRAGRAEEAFIFQYEDEGVPFNPLEWPKPVLTGGIEGRSIGGRGIYLIKKMTDRMSYTRLSDKNQLTVGTTPEAESGSSALQD
jgi:sigma-B regulation protein RsbU (phosphoserine phosphatase)